MGVPTSRDYVIAIKQARAERGYSQTRVEEEILRRGKSVSMSTLKRVFQDGSENAAGSFSYEHIILPLTEVFPEVWLMLGNRDTGSSDADADLKTELRLQAALLESKLEQIKILEDRVAFMKEQVSILRTQVEVKDRRMDEKDKTIQALTAERDELRELLDSANFRGTLVQFPDGSVSV